MRIWPLALCLLVAACSRSASDHGPLGWHNDVGTLCARGDKDGIATDGFLPLHNRGSHPVTVDSVKLTKPDGIDLHSSFLAPIRNNTLVGLRPGRVGTYPGKQKIPGAVLQAHADGNLLLELHLSDTEVAGHTGGLEVRYRVGSRDYRWVSRLDVTVAPARSRCQ